MTKWGQLCPCLKPPKELDERCYQMSKDLEKRQRRPRIPCLVNTRVVLGRGDDNFVNAK